MILGQLQWGSYANILYIYVMKHMRYQRKTDSHKWTIDLIPISKAVILYVLNKSYTYIHILEAWPSKTRLN